MKLKLALLFIFSILTSAVAQGPGMISGTVKDKLTSSPIPYATIVIKSGGKVLTGGITDDAGSFSIKNLALAKYDIEVQFIGYKSYFNVVEISESQKTVSLTNIILEEESTELEGVTVIAERSTVEQKIDRRVINVGKDLTTAGATASEIMGNIPSVNVDQDGNISLRGNGNVRILVDGRPTNMDAAQLLKQIPSTAIKKIELITNPSAKYNPEGMSGIINIILHKNSNNGFNASVNSGATFARTPKFNSSIDMNYREGKVNFFGTYGNNFGYNNSEGTFRRFDENSRQEMDVRNDGKSHVFKIGMDFYIDDRNTISAYTNQNIYNGKRRTFAYSTYPDPAFNYETDDFYKDENLNSSYNLAYKHLFEKEGHTLDIETNLNILDNEQNADFRVSGIDAIRKQERTNTTVNIDYVNPINEKSILELGAESRTVRTDNTYNATFVPSRDAAYTYDLDIYSAYVTFGQKYKKFSYQLGARFESYKVEAILNGAEAYADDYLTLYPSAYLTYSINEKNNLQLSYSRRVDRPGFDQTSPIQSEQSSLRFISVGNPELDPQFTNSIELNYTKTLAKGTFSGGIYYRIIDNEINRILYPSEDDPNVQIMSFANFDHNTAYGFELSANYKLTSWWDMQPAVDFSSINQQGLVSIFNATTADFEFVNKKVTANAFNGRLNNNFKASKRLTFSLFGFFRSGVDGLQFETNDMYKIDAGMRYSVLNNKGTLSLRVNDIFDTMRFGFYGANPFPQTGEFRWESQSVYVNFNYRFGAGKNRALQRKQRDENTQPANGGGMF
jgi:hypothetical protein